MRRWMYEVAIERRPAGWVLLVEGRPCSAPQPDEAAARRLEHQLVRRWSERARALGGRVWRATGARWGVELPDAITPRWGRPFRSEPCSRGA